MLTDSRGCLITGGAGFIGSHLVDALVENGWKVTVLDNFSTGRYENLTGARRKGQVRIMKGDVRHVKTVAKALAGVNVVFHLAALSSHGLAVKQPLLTNDVNVTGTINILRHAAKKKVERVVFASSAAVYGEPGRVPIREDAGAGALSPYGASKLAAEKYCQAFWMTYGLDTVCLRYFNVYGPRQRAKGEAAVVPEFLSKLRRERPLVIHDRGRQVRDFVHVGDVVRATILAARTRKASGETINVGTGNATSILALANRLIELAGGPRSRKIFDKPRVGDIYRSCADTSKAKKILGFEAKIDLEQGLKALTRPAAK